jgi:hypothetical protein
MDLLMEFRDHPDLLVRVQPLKVQLDQRALLVHRVPKEIMELKVIRANRDLRDLRGQLEQVIKLQAILLLF